MAAETPLPAQLADRRRQVLEAGLTNVEGADVFVRALRSGVPHLLVCTKDLHALARLMQPRPSSGSGAAGESASPLPASATPRQPRPALTTTYVAPDAATERQVCVAFAQALGLAEVGVHDNFFELGGHSLLAMEVMAQLNREFSASVPVAALYESLTAASLAAQFERSGTTLAAGREPALRRTGRRRPGAGRRRELSTDRRNRS